jgi:hypothetical protein
MRLCIADPPYLGRGAMLYGERAVSFPVSGTYAGNTKRAQSGDGNAAAAEWDDPERHRAMVESLADYDGWAIALNPENLHHYIPWVPSDTRICSWHKPNPFPAGRIVKSWEPVLVRVPVERRTRGTVQIRDSITAAAPGNLIGAKPRAWTRWVLDMLGYDPETDTVDDLFHGSGAVAAEIAQGVLNLDGGAA